MEYQYKFTYVDGEGIMLYKEEYEEVQDTEEDSDE